MKRILFAIILVLAASHAYAIPPIPPGSSSGDVTGVGDCASGACGDGSSDGGTYYRFYDGTSSYNTILGGVRLFTFSSALTNAENLTITLGNNDNTIALSSTTGGVISVNGTPIPASSTIVTTAAGTATAATSATNATNIGITDDTTTNATMYPVWVTANTGNLPAKVSSTGITYNPSTGVFSVPSISVAGSTTPLGRLLDSDAPGADKEIAAIGGGYVDGADGAENGTLSLYAFEAGTRTEYVKADGKNVQVVLYKPLAMGANSITMTGSLAATGARVTKGWFTDLESTNMPTVGGTALLSSLTAPVFSTSIEAPFLVLGTAATAADTGAVRLPNATYLYWEADAAGTDISGIGVDSSEVVQIGASGASGVTITPATTVTGNLTVNGGTFTMAPANDPYMALAETDGTDWWIGADDTGNTLEFRTNITVGNSVEMELNEDGSGVIFGDNGDDDFTLTVNANSNDGSFKWMEDENYWQYEDSVLLSGAIFAAGTQALSVTTEANITLSAPIVLITGDNDTDNDAIDLQNGTVAGQMIQLIGAATIDADDTITINMADTTCTNCPAVVFDKPGENASLTWTGATWVVTGLQSSL